MTKEEKQLLLIDLCARLPHGVVCEMPNEVATITEKIGFPGIEQFADGNIVVKPYLRPMSSITEEEEIELNKAIELELEALAEPEDGRTITSAAPAAFEIDFYNKHHLDFRGLIPKGLALEAPKDMYKTQ